MDTHPFKLKLLTIFAVLFYLNGCCLLPFKPKGKKVKMKVTAYCACQKCSGWERDCWSCWLQPVYAAGRSKGRPKVVGITSDGTNADHGTIAADIKYYPYGTRMYIEGYGWGTVHDTGGAIKGRNHIDLFFDDHEEALKWGVKTLMVTVIKPGK